MILAVALTACSKPPVEEPLTTKKLGEFYPGDISKVDSIVIVDGETGRRKVFTDKQEVQDWINQVKDMEFVPDPNQEGRSGFLYAVTLREKGEDKMGFSPNAAGGHYYIHNEELRIKIEELFENGEYLRTSY